MIEAGSNASRLNKINLQRPRFVACPWLPPMRPSFVMLMKLLQRPGRVLMLHNGGVHNVMLDHALLLAR